MSPRGTHTVVSCAGYVWGCWCSGGSPEAGPPQAKATEQGAGRGGTADRVGRTTDLRGPAHGHRGDREQQRPEGRGRHRAQQLGQRPLTAAQPGGGEQTDPDVRAEQRPGGRRVGLGEQGRQPVAALGGVPGGPDERCAHAGAVAAQHVEADGAQRARDGPAHPAVADVLAGGEDGVGGQLQRDQQGGDPPEGTLPPRQGVRQEEHGGGDRGHRVQRQRDPGQQHVRRGAERHDDCREQRRAYGSELGSGYVHGGNECVTCSGKGSLKGSCGCADGHRPGIRPLRNRSRKIWWSPRARAP
jgi:hypothetical protein